MLLLLPTLRYGRFGELGTRNCTLSIRGASWEARRQPFDPRGRVMTSDGASLNMSLIAIVARCHRLSPRANIGWTIPEAVCIPEAIRAARSDDIMRHEEHNAR